MMVPMKTLILAVALVLSACASSGPTRKTLNQSAFAPAPRPPAFSPAEDAPHTFEPDAPRRTVEPGPRPTRTLPQTDRTRQEAGVWASGEPVVDPILFRIPLPLPDDMGPEDRKIASYCAGVMAVAADWAGKAQEAHNLKPRSRQCLSAMLYAACMAKRKDQQYSAPEYASRFSPVRKAANGFEKDSCTDELRDAMRPLFEAIVHAWKANSQEAAE